MPPLNRRALLHSLSITGLTVLGGCASYKGGSESPTEQPKTASTVTTTDTTTMEPTEEVSSPSLGDGVGPLPEEPWPLSLRSASNCPVLPDGPSLSDDAREDWYAEPTAPSDEDPFSLKFSGPVVSDGQVIASNRLLFTTNGPAPDTQLLRAFDSNSGEETWKYTIGSQSDPAARDLPTTPAVWDDIVLVGHGQTVRAVDIEDGIESWRHQFGTHIHAVIPTDTLAYIRAHRSIIALSDGDNSAWSTPLEGFPGTLAVGQHHVYTSVSRRIYALDPENGEKRWSVELPAVEGGYGLSRLAAVEGGIIAIQNSGDIYVFDRDGERRWHSETQYDSFVTDGSRVYVRSTGILQALAVSTGEKVWAQTCSDIPSCDETTTFGPSVLTGDSLIVALDDGGLLGMTPTTGATRWSLADVPQFENLALGTDGLYGVGDDGTRLSRITTSE